MSSKYGHNVFIIRTEPFFDQDHLLRIVLEILKMIEVQGEMKKLKEDQIV